MDHAGATWIFLAALTASNPTRRIPRAPSSRKPASSVHWARVIVPGLHRPRPATRVVMRAPHDDAADTLPGHVTPSVDTTCTSQRSREGRPRSASAPAKPVLLVLREPSGDALAEPFDTDVDRTEWIDQATVMAGSSYQRWKNVPPAAWCDAQARRRRLGRNSSQARRRRDRHDERASRRQRRVHESHRLDVAALWDVLDDRDRPDRVEPSLVKPFDRRDGQRLNDRRCEVRSRFARRRVEVRVTPVGIEHPHDVGRLRDAT